MKKFSALLAGVLLPLAISAGASAQANNCQTTVTGNTNAAGQAGSRVTVANGIATATIVVTGDAGCQQTVSMATWDAPIGSSNFQPYTDQKLIATTTQVFSVGTHTISVKIDTSCMYQADVVLGGNPLAADGTADYAHPGSPTLLGWIQAGDKVCEEQPAPQPQPTPTPTQNNTEQQTQQTQQQVTEQPAPAPAPAVQPTELANTGPGSIATIFAGTSALGAVAHSVIRRKIANA